MVFLYERRSEKIFQSKQSGMGHGKTVETGQETGAPYLCGSSGGGDSTAGGFPFFQSADRSNRGGKGIWRTGDPDGAVPVSGGSTGYPVQFSERAMLCAGLLSQVPHKTWLSVAVHRHLQI